MMSLTIVQLSYLAQTIALSLSIFNLVAFLWLACTVWLNGEKRNLIVRVGVVGLGLSTLFFFIHALLIFGPPERSSGLISPDFLWRVAWFPALGVPYIWFVLGLHYAAQMNESWRRKRPLLLVIGALLGCLVLILLAYNRETFTFVGTLHLLAYGEVTGDTAKGPLSPLMLTPILFLGYVTFCAIGPWFTPGRIARLLHTLWHAGILREGKGSLRRRLVEAFWDDQGKGDQPDGTMLSWHLARPVLLLAALLMVGLTISLSAVGVWSLVAWINIHNHILVKIPAMAALNVIPLNLLALDIFATGLVAVIVLLFGYSIVRHGILIERPLARRGFFEQWRGTVIVATTVAIFIALLVDFTQSNLSGLLCITALATVTYALFTWSSYTAHDRYITLLRPFMSRTNIRHWLNTDLRRTEQNMEDLFFHLCKDVLGVECACLIVLSGPVRRSFTYHWPEQEFADGPVHQQEESGIREKLFPTAYTSPAMKVAGAYAHRVRMKLRGTPIICWVLPIYDELGPVARLYLGPRQDGGVFTDDDMSLAHACGQRILDTLRDHEAMLAVASLLRRRIVDVKLLGAQQRRVLHDEILPQMHLALLKLETLRTALHTEHEQSDRTLNEAITDISIAHRQLATMMRATTTSAPHRLERDGMMHAIYTMMKQDFQQAFDTLIWNISEETIAQIDELVPPAIAELIFAAVQEALRNAARHARGADVHRHLQVKIEATCNPHLEIIVADDGVGVLSASSSTTGTGGGLLTHSSLLAIAGGSMTITSTQNTGVTVRIFLPAEALR